MLKKKLIAIMLALVLVLVLVLVLPSTTVFGASDPVSQALYSLLFEYKLGKLVQHQGAAKWTARSWATFDAALKAAKSVLDNYRTVNAADADYAKANLIAAGDGLIEKGDVDTVSVQYYRVNRCDYLYNEEYGDYGLYGIKNVTKIFSTDDLKEYYIWGQYNGTLTLFGSNDVYTDSMTVPASLISKYDETFFQTHFLLFLSAIEGSGSIRHRIDSLEVKNNDLTINCSFLYPSSGALTTDYGCWQIVLELPISWKDFLVNVHDSIDNIDNIDNPQPPTAPVIYK